VTGSPEITLPPDDAVHLETRLPAFALVIDVSEPSKPIRDGPYKYDVQSQPANPNIDTASDTTKITLPSRPNTGD
jgi:hypothetical protein